MALSSREEVGRAGVPRAGSFPTRAVSKGPGALTTREAPTCQVLPHLPSGVPRPMGSTHPEANGPGPVPGAQGRRQEPAQKGQPGVAVTSSMSPNKCRLTFTEQVVGRACPRNGTRLRPSPMRLMGWSPHRASRSQSRSPSRSAPRLPLPPGRPPGGCHRVSHEEVLGLPVCQVASSRCHGHSYWDLLVMLPSNPQEGVRRVGHSPG